MIPTSIFRIWFLGLLSWVLLGVGIYLGHRWYQQAWSYDYNLQRSYFDPHIGYNHQTLLLFVAGCLLFLVLAGGLIVRGILGLLAKAKNPNVVSELPKKSREGATISQIGSAEQAQLSFQKNSTECISSIGGAKRSKLGRLACVAALGSQ